MYSHEAERVSLYYSRTFSLIQMKQKYFCVVYLIFPLKEIEAKISVY